LFSYRRYGGTARLAKWASAQGAHAYEELGSCALPAIESLAGRRLAQVRARRTKREFTYFCQALAAAYPDAIKIRLVLDNLNTHTHQCLL